MNLKCIVVEDSLIHKLAICKLIENHPKLELIDSFTHALEAIQKLKHTPVDLVFLDVEMPDFSGFDLIENLITKPQVIFTTSNPVHAVKAFEYEATDFLQKPFTVARFQAAVEKALKKQINTTTQDFYEDDQPYIFIKSNLVRYKVLISDIQYIEALGDYVKVFTKTQTYTVLSTMKSMEDQLLNDVFFRVHKSFIINLKKVSKIKGSEVVIDQKMIPISRHKKQELKSKFTES
jgi:two-component system, LytTR family, response regulator